MRKLLLCALLAAEALGAQRTTTEITTADLEYRLKIIADDSMMGRESGSKGDYMAAEYVASEFKRLGLEPAGEGGTYFQTVPFWRATIDSSSRLTVQGTTLNDGIDFVVPLVRAPQRTLDNVPVVYGGDASDSATWIAPAEATGKFVVLDVPANTVLRGLGRMLHRWHPAVTVAIVNLDQFGSEQRARLREGFPISDTTRDAALTPVIYVSQHAAEVLRPGATVSGHFDVSRI